MMSKNLIWICVFVIMTSFSGVRETSLDESHIDAIKAIATGNRMRAINSNIPDAITSYLDSVAIGEIIFARKHGKFSSTDVRRRNAPIRRLALIIEKDDSFLIAYEKGGKFAGYRLLRVVLHEGKVTDFFVYATGPIRKIKHLNQLTADGVEITEWL
jgi:hypothetical protein